MCALETGIREHGTGKSDIPEELACLGPTDRDVRLGSSAGRRVIWALSGSCFCRVTAFKDKAALVRCHR